MELQAASLAQVRRGRDGRQITIDEDVLGVVKELKQIDPGLKVRWNEVGEYFVVYEVLKDGTESLVTTTPTLDGRLVKHMRRLGSEDYDYVAEIERMDTDAERAKDRVFSERVGELGEQAAHALRQDLNPGKVILPRGI
jgi:hypothetical protein